MQITQRPLLWLLAIKWYLAVLALVVFTVWLYTKMPPQVKEAFTATPADGPGLTPWDFSVQRAQPDLPTPAERHNEPDETIFYIFWTGGYDSTFRLCEMLLDENKVVQPLYVSYALDNDCETEETCNKLWVRRNRKQEKKAMLAIRRAITDTDPQAAQRLLPTRFITQDIDDASFTKWFEKRFYSANLWPKKRKKHQYLALAKWAAYHETYVDVGVLGIHDQSAFAKFLLANLDQIHCSCPNGQHPTSGTLAPPAGINYQIRDREHPLRYLRFPLWGRSKRDLLDRARLRGYDHVLKLTWSCWFPNAQTGKPCGKCPMCRERILPHNQG